MAEAQAEAVRLTQRAEELALQSAVIPPHSIFDQDPALAANQGNELVQDYDLEEDEPVAEMRASRYR